MSLAYDAVVVGASAGGISCLRRVLAELPMPFPLPILVVQHIHASATLDYSMVFCSPPGLKAKEAEEKESILPGWMYVAPPGYHLLVEKNHTLSLSVDPLVNYSRPSIDVLFESAADAFGKRLIGIVLTGANGDGALGLKAIKDTGGLTIVQEPADAEVSAMPLFAIKAAQPQHILKAEAIGQFLATLAQ